MKYNFFYSGPFSNFYHAPFEDEGVTYNCSEQYFMAHKALLFDDYTAYRNIMSAQTPRKQKAIGRLVTDFDDERWDAFKCMIMFRGCLQKFLQNPHLRYILLNTGYNTLVEASPTDKIWGIGWDKSNAMDNIDNWGQNLLGKTLMQIRGILRKE